MYNVQCSMYNVQMNTLTLYHINYSFVNLILCKKTDTPRRTYLFYMNYFVTSTVRFFLTAFPLSSFAFTHIVYLPVCFGFIVMDVLEE